MRRPRFPDYYDNTRIPDVIIPTVAPLVLVRFVIFRLILCIFSARVYEFGNPLTRQIKHTFPQHSPVNKKIIIIFPRRSLLFVISHAKQQSSNHSLTLEWKPPNSCTIMYLNPTVFCFLDHIMLKILCRRGEWETESEKKRRNRRKNCCINNPPM